MTIRRVMHSNVVQVRDRPPIGTPAWGRHSLQMACDRIRASASAAGDSTGGRHATTRDQAFWIGRLLAAGHLQSECYAREQLLRAALEATGDQKRKRALTKTIDSGLAKGAKRPWRPNGRK